MNVLFCNIAWMKYYEGVNEVDKPKNGGSYVKENEYGNECFNFQDYNEKCYGFVMLNGNMSLKSHYKEAKKSPDSLKDVLVIWVATNDTNETRIVGWYKNATVFSQEQSIHVFTHEEFNRYYRIEALAKDCFLIPEDQRSFPIQRAAQTGKGTGMGRSNIWYADSEFAQTTVIPKVIDYIDNYNGEFVNKVFNDEMLSQVTRNKKILNDYNKLYKKGMKCLNREEYMSALKFFNTARLIKETPDILFNIAESLLSLNCFDKAISIYKKVIDMEGNSADTIERLILCYDRIGDTEKTIEYCNKLISLLGDSKEGIGGKICYSCVLFDIYLSLKNKKKASEIIDKIATYSNDDETKMIVEQMKNIIKEENVFHV